MKKLILIVLTLAMFNCSNDDDSIQEEQTIIPEATLLGRWIPEGFEETIRYEFTDEGKRFALYSIDGVFPTLEDFNSENPQLNGLDWYYENEVVVVDLNFGNYSRLIPQFVCENRVIQWFDEDGEPFGVYYREGVDISNCQELQ